LACLADPFFLSPWEKRKDLTLTAQELAKLSGVSLGPSTLIEKR
jgi:hypothetical protein